MTKKIVSLLLALVMILSLACTVFAVPDNEYSPAHNVKVNFDNDMVAVGDVRINAFDNIIFYAKAKPGYRITSIVAHYDGVLTDGVRPVHYVSLLGRYHVETPLLWWLYRDYEIDITAEEIPTVLTDHVHLYQYDDKGTHEAIEVTCIQDDEFMDPCTLPDGWKAILTVEAKDGIAGKTYTDAKIIEDDNWHSNSDLTHTDIVYFSHKNKDITWGTWSPLDSAPTEAGTYAAVVFANVDGDLKWAQAYFTITSIPKYTLTVNNANATGYANATVYGEDGSVIPFENENQVTLEEGKTVRIVYETPDGYKFDYPTGKTFVDWKTCYEDVTMGNANTSVNTPAVEKIEWHPVHPDYPVEPEKPAHNTVVIEIGKKAEENGENNPDTGAPSMNLAAVTVVLGAAIVVSKKH